MGSVVMKLKVMPNDVEVDLEALKEKIKEVAPEKWRSGTSAFSQSLSD